MAKYNPDDFYRSLKALDADFQKHFADPSLDAAAYFRIAFKEEVVSSCLSILINDEYSNLISSGVDANCREILESISLLAALDRGEISPEQCELYRQQYLLVEYDNSKPLYAVAPMSPEEKEKIAKIVSEVKDHYCQQFHCSLAQLPDFLRDPLYFLSKPGQKIPGFLELVKAHLGEEAATAYSFFSINEHPHYGPRIAKILNPIRTTYIQTTVKAAFAYLSEAGDLTKHNENRTIAEEEKDPVYGGHIQFLQTKLKFADKMIIKATEEPGGTNLFLREYLEQMMSLYIDMRLNLTFGYAEQALIKAKPFIEQSAVFQRIESSQDVAQMNFLIRGFAASTAASFGMLLQKAARKSDYDDDELPLLYRDYYKAAYHLPNYSLFRDTFVHHSLYFLSPTPLGYNSLSGDFFQSWRTTPEKKAIFQALYKASQDMGHGGGYLFDSSVDLWNYGGKEALFMLNDFLCYFFTNYEAYYFSEHKDSPLGDLVTRFVEICNLERLSFTIGPIKKVN
jgi:hypothetical protein